MLAGSNRVDMLTHFVKRMSTFSDDGKTLNGAYGYRWRQAEVKRNRQEFFDRTRVDQLTQLVEAFRLNQHNRRCVLQMWNVEDDLMQVDTSKDVCCNTAVYFSTRNDTSGYESRVGVLRYREHDEPLILDCLVTNRSNDMVWGAFGANLVHFSYLLEYMAQRCGFQVGSLITTTINGHIYKDNWNDEFGNESSTDYEHIRPWEEPLITTGWEEFDNELMEVVIWFGNPENDHAEWGHLRNDWIRDVVVPMMQGHLAYRHKNYELATTETTKCAAPDWRAAGLAWITKRRSKHEQ